MFKFKLASVLSLKEKMEDSKKRELGEAIMQAEKVADEKSYLIRQKNLAIKEAQEENMGVITVAHLRAFNQYNSRVDKEINKKNEQLIAANKVVVDKRNELLEAVKERKILDNLKAIQEEVYLEEEKREEQRIVDDLVTYKYGIKGKES